MEQTARIAKDGRTVIVLTPSGRLDITTAYQFRQRLLECISTVNPHVIVNLEKANFIDSSGLTSLVAGMREAERVQGSFRICSIHPDARLVFEVTLMDSVFEIFETEEQALTGLSSGLVS
jgi:anti-anti-sigma factor